MTPVKGEVAEAVCLSFFFFFLLAHFIISALFGPQPFPDNVQDWPWAHSIGWVATFHFCRIWFVSLASPMVGCLLHALAKRGSGPFIWRFVIYHLRWTAWQGDFLKGNNWGINFDFLLILPYAFPHIDLTVNTSCLWNGVYGFFVY